ncbi:hypothetical protein KY359_02425 [Candidatus Woesearchaeota archaeon]|nr:hypothetical protein [Candidatus Woesearchaeota archaeon]
MNKGMIAALLISVMIVSMLVFGCAQQQPAPKIEPDVEMEPEPEQEVEPVAEPEPEPEVDEEPEPEAEEPEEYNLESLPKAEQSRIKSIRALLDEARGREENYFFRYTGPGVTQSDVWVKGDLMKRSIIMEAKVDKYNPYNMVYMNRNTLTAAGYCEARKASCPDGKGPFTESFSKRNNIKTPKEWILELDNNFRWALDNKIGDQLYHIIDYNMDDKVVRLYVNNYRGWPARVEIYRGKTKIDSVITKGADDNYIYDDMNIGGVSDDDVTPG